MDQGFYGFGVCGVLFGPGALYPKGPMGPKGPIGPTGPRAHRSLYGPWGPLSTKDYRARRSWILTSSRALEKGPEGPKERTLYRAPDKGSTKKLGWVLGRWRKVQHFAPEHSSKKSTTNMSVRNVNCSKSALENSRAHRAL